MVKYLNACEEKIVDYLAWQPDSPLWSQLDAVKLASPQPNEPVVKTQLDMPFPLYDEVNTIPMPPSASATNGAQQTGLNNGSNGLLGAVVSASANSNSNSEIILNLTPNPQTTSANYASSPVKHPTITRVVGSSASANNETNSPTAARVLLHQAKSKINRLQSVSGSLTYFLRKFYSLANARMRELVEKLDSTNDLFHQHSAKSEAVISSTPAAAATAAASIITPTTTMITNTNNQHIHLITEQQQLFYKKIWNIFEYSVSVGGASSSNLMQNRTLDQVLMCAVYTACKISGVSIQFQDIIRIVSSTRVTL
jgi:hypothetical protein